MSESERERADQSVSARFTRVMNATPSPWGMLTDPSIVGIATAPLGVALVAAVRLEAAPTVLAVLEVLVAVPLAVAIAVALFQTSTRARVVDWLASVRFPVENMNAILNGLGDSLEVTFSGPAPDVKALNLALDRVSPDCFVSKSTEDTKNPDVVELRIGVVDSKRNPSASNYRRFTRVKALVSDVLIPLDDAHPIVEVRVK